MKKVVIIGAGFAGLQAAKVLANQQQLYVTIIDRQNHHLFQPLLYQVATAGLSPADIAVPIRSIVGIHKNISVVLGEVEEIDLKENQVRFCHQQISYDYLIIAAGAKHSYFANPQWASIAPGLKTLSQATEIRRRLLLSYEKAEIENDPHRKKALMTFVIVGGGPTGVEMAGAIAEIGRQTMARDFKNIDPGMARVILIEAGPRILANFDSSLAKQATRDLESMGVQVWVSSMVTGIYSDRLELGTEIISTFTVIWAAGVLPSPLGRFFPGKQDSIGRVMINEFLQVPENPEVFVVGDMAHFKTVEGQVLPGLAPVAIQQGKRAAQNILRSVQQKKLLPFKYKDKGMMATIGRKKAIMQFAGLKVSGFWAWIAWLVIHIFYLIGFRNKILVFINWCWSYLTFRKGARLIVDRNPEKC